MLDAIKKFNTGTNIEFHIPTPAINLFVRKLIKPRMSGIDLSDMNKLEFFETLFDGFCTTLDFALNCRTRKEFLDCGLELDWIISSKVKKKSEHVILYIHGGGFISFSPRSHKSVGAYLSQYTNGVVVFPNYTKSYKKMFPCAIEECYRTYEHLLNKGYKPENITIAGDSAGGNLALALAIMIRDRLPTQQPECVILYSPWIDLTNSLPSRTKNKENDHMLPTEKFDDVVNFYCKPHELSHPYVCPLNDDLQNLPRMQIHVGDRESLVDDSVAVYRKLNNLQNKIYIWNGCAHVFHVWAKINKDARRCLKVSSDFITGTVI
jgi:monoterpene epsilon-lactone hydrolase